MKKFMGRIRTFMEALLGDDEKLVLDVFARDGQLLPGAGPTVQKIFYEAHKDELVAAAKAYKAKKANK